MVSGAQEMAVSPEPLALGAPARPPSRAWEQASGPRDVVVAAAAVEAAEAPGKAARGPESGSLDENPAIAAATAATAAAASAVAAQPLEQQERVATPPPLTSLPPSPRGPSRSSSGGRFGAFGRPGPGPIVAVPEKLTTPEAREARRASGLVSRVVDVMRNSWKVRSSREEAAPSAQETFSWWRRAVAVFASDLWFALGRFKGGGLLGPPLSIQQMYNAKVEIEPTLSPSEGFESSCGRPSEEEDLDSSLQLISKRMKEILSRIEGRCRMSAVRFLGWVLGKLWRSVFAAIEVDLAGVRRAREGLERAARSGSAVMLLPTHRSHVDYLLMSYLHFGFNMAVPHIASGDNLNIPVIGPLFSYSGAFFLRRSFRGDNLYKKVLYGYLLRKLREGAPVEVFIEGGRSRTGMISEPKLGMILMAVRFVREGSLHDVTLMPSSIDYERALETEGHVAQLLGSKKKKESLVGTLSSGLGILFGSSNYGNAYVNFASGISVRKVLDDVDAAHGGDKDLVYVSEEVYVKAVSREVVRAQRQLSFLTPIAFVAAALLGSTSEEPSTAGAGAASAEASASEGDADSLLQAETSLLQRMAFLFRMARASGACLPPSLDLDDDDNAVAVLERAQEVLRPFLPRDEVGEVAKNPQTDLEAGAAEALADDPRFESEARRRLYLRYSCGQLIPTLAPACVVAIALQSMTSKTAPGSPVRAEGLLRSAAFIAEIVRNHVPGADLDAGALRLALADLADASVVRVTAENDDGSPAQVAQSTDAASEDHLRMLRILLAPAVAACCAILSAVVALMHEGTFSRDDLIALARKNVLAHARGEGTDWARRNGGDAEPSLARIVPTPEALSSVELRAAVKTLQTMGIIATPISASYGPMGMAGMGSASQASLMSMSSSRSFSSLNSSEEKRSSGSAEGGNQAEVSTQNKFEVCAAFSKGDGMKLLEKLSSFQRHMYRESAPVDAWDDVLASAMHQQQSAAANSGLGSWGRLGALALAAGACIPFLAARARRHKIL